MDWESDLVRPAPAQGSTRELVSCWSEDSEPIQILTLIYYL